MACRADIPRAGKSALTLLSSTFGHVLDSVPSENGWCEPDQDFLRCVLILALGYFTSVRFLNRSFPTKQIQ